MENNSKHRFIKPLKELSMKKYSYLNFDVIDDFLSLLFYPLFFVVNKNNQRKYLINEKDNILKKYKRNEINMFKEAIELFGECAEENPFEDLLGDIILELKSQSDKQWKGQFFTPQSICNFMAQATIDITKEDVEKRLKKGKVFSMLEPACGSGRNILAVAKYLKENIKEIPYHRYFVAVGIDIDVTCIKMTGINCSLFGIPLKLVHGNALLPLDQAKAIYTNIFYEKLNKQIFLKRKILNDSNKNLDEITEKSIKTLKQLSLF